MHVRKIGHQLALLCAEINVVWNNRLWPRSIAPPPLTDADREVYGRIVLRARMRPEVRVDVSSDDLPSAGHGRSDDG